MYRESSVLFWYILEDCLHKYLLHLYILRINRKSCLLSGFFFSSSLCFTARLALGVFGNFEAKVCDCSRCFHNSFKRENRDKLDLLLFLA